MNTLLVVQVTNPWSLETVSSFMSSKYNAEKTVLSEVALSSYMHKRMDRAQLCTAMRLALENRRKEWALLIRFALAWMSSSARRASVRHGMLLGGGGQCSSLHRRRVAFAVPRELDRERKYLSVE